jgi:hypothetical protein
VSLTLETVRDKILTAHASGKLRNEDYERFVPAVDRLIEESGPIRILFDMEDFQDGKLRAAWEDLEFGLKHLHDVERLAMVGENAWERWMASFCQPFTKAEVRFYERSEADAARSWIEEE